MKILCDVSLQGVEQYDQTEFRWLKGPENYLFALENRSKFRVFSIRQQQQQPDTAGAYEVQSTLLKGTCQCTCLAWNKDESLLAMVIDKRQIHIWEVRHDRITPFRPRTVVSGGAANHQMASNRGSSNLASGGGGGGQQSMRAKKSIELVAWSKISNKLAICYATGQILLCELAPSSSREEVAQPADQGQGQGQGTHTSDRELPRFSSTWERFIDNSESVLKRIVSIEVSEQAELFACFSAASEILIMTFDGHIAFYSQGEGRAHLYNAKFSPLKREHSPRTGQYVGQTICLAYQSNSHDGALLTKRISLEGELDLGAASPPVVEITDFDPDSQHSYSGQVQQVASELVNFHWLGPTQLLICLASGSIQIIQLDTATATTTSGGTSRASSPTSTTGGGGRSVILQSVDSQGQRTTRSTPLLHLRRSGSRNSARRVSMASGRSQLSSGSPTQTICPVDKFKIFELMRSPRKSRDSSLGYALAIGTSYKLHYYELFQEPSSGEFSIERFDDLDLGESLQRVDLRLERARWSQDCSMLALQLTSGHLLIYRTRLQQFVVAAHNSRAAYLSAPNEVTILNYSAASATCEQAEELAATSPSAPDNKALILSVPLRPSLLAIGPKHLALALNNRVRFYSLDSLHHDHDAAKKSEKCHEREYAAIVAGVGLCSRFAAVQFQDEGRLKLHSLKRSRQDDRPDEADEEERLFPDPSQPERISTFALTEQLLIYSTRCCKLAVFCLKTWRLAQVCDHSRVCPDLIWRLKPNARGNKFVCLIERPSCTSSASANTNRRHPTSGRHTKPVAAGSGVFLYDLYTNEVCAAICGTTETEPLWLKLVVYHQIQMSCATLPVGETTSARLLRATGLLAGRELKMGAVTDAIWDTDGRTVLLTGQRQIHALAVLDHTLERESPITVYASSARKPSSYTTLYVHQGIVSYQMSLGQVCNEILETHDDEARLGRLEVRIRAIKDGCCATTTTGECDPANDHNDQVTTPMRILEAHLEVMLLKVNYLRSIMPIYSLPKCRDICKILMEEEAFNLDASVRQGAGDELDAHMTTVDQIIWQVLAAWSLFTLNLDFASLIYRRNKLHEQASGLSELLRDIKAGGGSNLTRTTVVERISALLSPKVKNEHDDEAK